MLRHKMDTKQQGEHIEHKPKKQAKYKKHFKLRYYFPRMSSESEMSDYSISWREKSTETEGEKFYFGERSPTLIAQTKIKPSPRQMLDLWSKTMEKPTKTVLLQPFCRLDTCDKTPLNPGNNKKASFLSPPVTQSFWHYFRTSVGTNEMLIRQDGS